MRYAKWMAVALAALFLLSCAEKRDLYFFYLELCPSCDEYVAAEKMAEKVEKLGGQASNIIGDEDAKVMKEVLDIKGLADISHSLPILIEGDEYLVGYEEISAEIDRLFTEK